MIKMAQYLLLILTIAVCFPQQSIAQDIIEDEFSYDVGIVYPALSVSREVIKDANTIMDINRHYKTTWVKEYYSVDVLTSQKGTVKKASGKSEVLTAKQKKLISNADMGEEITIQVHYLPDNTLSTNEPKHYEFSFEVSPEVEAQYSGGEKKLMSYLEDEAISKISKDKFEQWALAAVKFTIDEKGHIVDPSVFESSNDEEIDKVLLDAICNMPSWMPAAYANGQNTAQEFVLMVGSMQSCVINTLNLRRELEKPE